MMGWWKRLNEQMSFTPTERAVVLTLVAAFVVGLGVRMFRGGEGAAPAFDYSRADSEFAAKSAAPAAGSARGAAIEDSNDVSGGPSGVSDPGRTTAARPPRTAAPAAGRIELNTATKRDLMSLPGVGEVIAERILLYREEHGAFAKVDDLLRVRGIGKKTLEKIAPFCFVQN